VVSLNEIHENDLFITQSRVRDACADNGDMEYLKKEFAFRGGRWDGRDISPVWKASDGARILVLGDSDEEFSLGAFAALRALGRYQQIWSTHVAGNKQKFVNALPIGLPYDRHYGFPFDVIGDVSLVRKAFLTTALPAVEDMKILGSFEDRNSADRPALRTILREVRRGRVQEFPVTRGGHLKYLQAMRSSGVVACPRGRGIDTYRLWEALYMGALPVILRPPSTFGELLDGLPILYLDDWNELRDENLVLAAYEKFCLGEHCYRNASLPHLMKKISGYQST
jgi:hypothetical protein